MTGYLFGITDIGKVSKNNEDVFIAEEVMNGQFMVVGVIDGVGGYEGGEIAAAITKEVLLDELAVIGSDVTAQLVLAFNLANEEIVAKKLGDLQLLNMACVATVAVIDLKNNVFHYIHVGDTRLYLFRDNSLVKISHDQSQVGFLEDSGRITEEAAMQHPKRNQVNQALGLETLEEKVESYFETGSSPFLPGDLILVCSDGLTDLVDKASIASVLSSPLKLQAKAETLIEEANNAGGKDNITVVLAKNDKPQVVHDVLPPVVEFAVPVAQPVNPVIRPANTIPPVVKPVREHKGMIILLAVLSLLFLSSTIWLFLNNPPVKLKGATPVAAVAVPALNPQEKLITDTLSKLKGDTLLLSAKFLNGPVVLSKALTINRDTLVIKTSGDVVFQSDSLYKGPALILSPVCKYVVIDKLVLQNFEIGVVSYKNVLELKNVSFNNCRYPLQVLFGFPDHSFVTGRVSKRAYQADSLLRK